ncbi:putative deoxyribonuclease TATDN2 [Ptychodera flava]|uniref:putative deoxyribonuclease TATDN2 n=1 Tax=Ptychodera flava TaxID=63121 RepID=UPI003969D36E
MRTATSDAFIFNPLIQKSSSGIPLLGGVEIYCDPVTYPKDLHRSPRWKIAVGIHPKQVGSLTENRLQVFGDLVRSPQVTALGEIGLDYSVKPDKWPLQEKVFRLALPYCVREKPLILLIRGASGDGCIVAVGRSALNIVREYCGREQLIHLHCFMGTNQLFGGGLRSFPIASSVLWLE